MDKKTLERIYDAGLHVDAILHLGSMTADADRVNDAVDDMLSTIHGMWGKGLEQLPTQLQEWMAFAKGALGDDEDDSRVINSCFAEWLVPRGYLGFLIQAIRPSSRGPGNICWFYGATYEEAVGAALTWAEPAPDRAQPSAEAT